jgi:hypothetical protein
MLTQQNYLTDRLSWLTSKPTTSRIHIHPLLNSIQGGEINAEGDINTDDEVGVPII